MKNVRNLVLALVVVVISVSNVNASLSESINYKGIHTWSYASNNEDNSCYATIGGYLEQGIEGRYYKYNSSDLEFRSDSKDYSKFNVNYSITFEVVSSENFVPNLNLDIYSNTNLNILDIYLSKSLEIRNRQEWYESGDDEWDSIKTTYPEFNSYFSLEPGKIENTSLRINEYSWNYYDYDLRSEVTRRTMYINFQAYGHFIAPTIEEARAIGMNFAVIPEPATILIVGLGGLLVKIRK